MRRSRLAAAALLASALVGCGGAGGGATTSPAEHEGGGAVGESPPVSTTGSTESGAGAPGHGGSAREPHFEGSDEEIERSGAEAAGSERSAVLGAEHAYLAALIAGDFRQACTYVSSSIERSLQAMVPASAGEKSCAEILTHLVGPEAARIVKPQLEGKIVRVRVKGSQGFVIFHAPGARLYAFPMSRERGGWRVGALNAEVLAPSPATLGE